jgi:hypothetical protein
MPTSAKLERMMQILRGIMAAEEQEKVLVFSQWTSFLNLVEVEFQGTGWEYLRYEGTMDSNARSEVEEAFDKEDKNIRIMLVCSKLATLDGTSTWRVKSSSLIPSTILSTSCKPSTARVAWVINGL